jgi:hypothetical protein
MHHNRITKRDFSASLTLSLIALGAGAALTFSTAQIRPQGFRQPILLFLFFILFFRCCIRFFITHKQIGASSKPVGQVKVRFYKKRT